MVSEPGIPTLDQLRVLLTVVDVGSFAGAARKLRRATSVISYAIANLEAQLGVLLFDRKSTRKPQLTDAGRTVLAEARTVANGVDGLRAKVKGLLQGLEAEVHIVIDVMMPAYRVVDALKTFRREFPTVLLHLHIETLGAVTQQDMHVIYNPTQADLWARSSEIHEFIKGSYCSIARRPSASAVRSICRSTALSGSASGM